MPSHLHASDQAVEILYPSANERIQPGEACRIVLKPLQGMRGKIKGITYKLTNPENETRVVHALTGKDMFSASYPPMQTPGEYVFGVEVMLKDGTTREQSVSINVESGQYDYWPAYDYTTLQDLEEITPEPWVDENHTRQGWDWSLPEFVTPAPRSALGIERRFNLSGQFQEPNFKFPVHAVGSLWVTWKELEPVEGQIDLSVLEQVIRDAKAKGVDIALRIMFSNKGKIKRLDADGKPVYDTSRSFAPAWLADKGIKEIKYPNGHVDYDPLDPVFHRYYARLVRALGQSDIPELLANAYVGYTSKSYGDEDIGPEVKTGEDPAELYPVVKDRLDVWAEAFRHNPHKVYMGGPSQYGMDLGFGVRRGFVEKYLYEIPDITLGSYLDEQGYLNIDETSQVHADGLFNGEENEEYEVEWTRASRDHRFGYTTSTFPYRYFVSSLRMLQMRSNFVLTGPGHLIEGMLPFVSLQLGRTVDDAPDVWTYLNTSYIRTPYYRWNEYQDPPRKFSAQEEKQGYVAVRNFERWLHQRDRPGYETEPRVKVNQPHEMWMVPKHKPYDFIARGGKKIGFEIDDRWLEKNRDGRLAIKASFIDSDAVKRGAEDGSLLLKYMQDGKEKTESIELIGGDELRTTTFFVDGLDSNALSHGFDFTLEAGNGAEEIVVSMVRVVAADPLVEESKPVVLVQSINFDKPLGGLGSNPAWYLLLLLPLPVLFFWMRSWRASRS